MERNNLELATEYGLDIIEFVTDPQAALDKAVLVCKDLLSKLDSTEDARPQTASEFKKNMDKADITPAEAENLVNFKQDLHDLFSKYDAFNSTKFLAQMGRVLHEQSKVCDDVLEMNLSKEFNLNKIETLGKKQLHRDFIGLRKLIFTIAAASGIKITKNDLPGKGGNFGDDLPIQEAEVAFYSHDFEVQEFKIIADEDAGYDEDGNAIHEDLELTRVRTFKAGEPAHYFALSIGLLHVLTRHDFARFIDVLTDKFEMGEDGFYLLGLDYDSEDDPFNYRDGDKLYALYVRPAGTIGNEAK